MKYVICKLCQHMTQNMFPQKYTSISNLYLIYIILMNILDDCGYSILCYSKYITIIYYISLIRYYEVNSLFFHKKLVLSSQSIIFIFVLLDAVHIDII